MSESQKETFRKYLEQAGAIDVLVKGGACFVRDIGPLSVLERSHVPHPTSVGRMQLLCVAANYASACMDHALWKAWTDHRWLCFCSAVLVQLYEEPSKPKQALE